MSSFRIEVTQDDIRHGTPADATSCPIARAMRRLFPKAVDIHVGIFDVELHQEYPDVSLPDEAVVFIDRFDSNDKVLPLTFEVEVDDNLLAAIRP